MGVLKTRRRNGCNKPGGARSPATSGLADARAQASRHFPLGFLDGGFKVLPEFEPILDKVNQPVADPFQLRRREALQFSFDLLNFAHGCRLTQRPVFKHEQGALYVTCLLLEPPPEPMHAVALALKAGNMGGQAPGPAEATRQRNLGLDDAAAVRALWRRQRALEAVLEDDRESEPVKAEALRELEEVTEFLRKSPWRSRGGAARCVRAVSAAIKRLHVRLAQAVHAEGKPHPVLQAFARHLFEHLLVPSGRGGDTQGGGPPRLTPGASPTSRRREWFGIEE